MILAAYLLLGLVGCVAISSSVAYFIRGRSVMNLIYAFLMLILGGAAIITTISHLAVK